MGVLSNKIERDNLKPGDHIYSWRHAYIYAHHGAFLILPLLFCSVLILFVQTSFDFLIFLLLFVCLWTFSLQPIISFLFCHRNLMEIFDFGVTFVGPISPMFQERTKIQSFIPHMNIRCYMFKLFSFSISWTC
jgi:hypothetical protein